jgi:hypothetical protein
VSAVCSHFLIAVIVTLHEIEESALHDLRRSQLLVVSTKQDADADTLTRNWLVAVAVVTADIGAAVSLTRTAAIDVLNDAAEAASAVLTRCAANETLTDADADAEGC